MTRWKILRFYERIGYQKTEADIRSLRSIKKFGLIPAVSRARHQGRLWAENDYFSVGRTIIHVNAMSTSVRHFLSLKHDGCGSMSASFGSENL